MKRKCKALINYKVHALLAFLNQYLLYGPRAATATKVCHKTKAQ